MIAQEKYKKIEKGMTDGDVIAIIGADGVLVDSSDKNGIEHETYEWQSKDKNTADVSFENGRLLSKKRNVDNHFT